MIFKLGTNGNFIHRIVSDYVVRQEFSIVYISIVNDTNEHSVTHAERERNNSE